jgi:aspartokinase/homoserine dehydrogenase 1
VIVAKTNRAAREYFSAFWRESRRMVPVVTGFIGRTEGGRTTTIGRNGSDCTAAIIGAALDASAIEIWTDVDGVLSADPKAVPSAFVLPQMTYGEAMEMSCFGAKVLHAGAIAPAVAKSIPIVIKNSFNPSAPGTRISRKPTNGYRLAKGISSMSDLTLLTLRGRGMAGVRGAAERLFRALAAQGVNVILTFQGASDTMIAELRDVAAAAQAVVEEFRLGTRVDRARSETDQAIIAVIGEGMRGRPDVAGRCLARSGGQHPISAIAQGASERNISCVADASQYRARSTSSIRVFRAPPRWRWWSSALGHVGGALMRQLCERRLYLLSRVQRPRSRSPTASGSPSADGIDLGSWREALDTSDQRMDPRALAQEIARLDLTNAALIDCTAAPSIVDAYPAFIKANLHIVTSNKRANVLPWRRYSALQELLAAHQKRFLYETNVGADCHHLDAAI